MTNKVEELTRLALRDPTFVDADEANKDAPADDEGPGAAAAGDADGNTAAFSTPKQLRQYFVEVRVTSGQSTARMTAVVCLHLWTNCRGR